MTHSNPSCCPPVHSFPVRNHIPHRGQARFQAQRWGLRLTLLLACVALGMGWGAAQTAQFAGAQSVALDRIDQPAAVALDASGNLYVASGDFIYKETPQLTGGYSQSTVVSDSSAVSGVAVDNSGNVFFVDALGVDEAAPAGAGYSDTQISPLSQPPSAIALDAAGNVYVALNSGGTAYIGEYSFSAGVWSVTHNIAVSGSNYTGLAVDAAGYVFAADSSRGIIEKFQFFTGGYTGIHVVAGLNQPEALAVDGQDNLYIVQAGEVMKASRVYGLYSPAVIMSGLNAPEGIALSNGGDSLANGNDLWVADSGNNRIEELQSGAVDFGGQTENATTPDSLTFNFNFSTGGAISAPQVLTQGAANLDFTDAGTGTCDTNGAGFVYAAGDTCSVVVAFNPKFAGTRIGAVTLRSSSDEMLATVNIFGLGAGPQVVFDPGAVQRPLGGGLVDPSDMAVDGQDDVFVADPQDSTIKMIPANCADAACVVSLGGGFNTPEGVAVDGQGNVYVADTFNGNIKEMTANCHSSACVTQFGLVGWNFLYPTGVAVDKFGNIFVSDTENDAIKEMTPNCHSDNCIKTLVSGFPVPGHIAVDGNDNLYFQYQNVNNRLYNLLAEIPAGCASPSCVKNFGGYYNYYNDFNVVVDATGSIYLASTDARGVLDLIKKIPPGCNEASCVQTVATRLDQLGAIAMDGRGNLYITEIDPNNAYPYYVRVGELLRGQPAPQSFANTLAGATSSDSPRDLTVENIGNQPMDLSLPAFPADFPDAQVANDCAALSSVPVAGICGIGLDFSPLPADVPGTKTLTATLILTDNHLNIAGTTQSISLTGLAILRLTLAPTSLPAAQINQAYNVQFTVDNGTGPYTFSSGTLPAGLSLTPSGDLFGTPTAAGVFSFTISASDSSSPTSTGNVDESLTVASGVKTITFPSLASPVLVGSTATLQATASNGDPVSYSITSGTASFSGSTLTFTNAGQVTITANSPASANYPAATPVSQTITVNPVAITYSAPTTPVNQSSPAQTAWVNFTAAGSLGNIAVVTQGAPAQDFKFAAGGTCVLGQAYTIGEVCSVNYIFAPQAPGERQGGIVLTDDHSQALGVSYLGGVGTGPLGLFTSFVPTWTVSNPSLVDLPRGLSVDGNDNVYFANTSGSAQGLNEIPAGGGTVIQLAATPVGTGATAVDGAGNIYLADADQQAIDELVQGKLVAIATGFSPDDNLEVDGAGNLYTSDYNTGAIYKIAAGTHAVTTLIPGNQGHRFIGMAVDPAGDLFAADFNNNVLYEIKAGTNTLTVLYSGDALYNPHSVALDPAGNVYIGNLNGTANIVRLPAGTGPFTTLPALGTRSLAIDGLGNLYAVVNETTITGYSRSNPPTIIYSNTVYGSGSGALGVEFENDGNAPLLISGYAASANFGDYYPGSSCVIGTLEVGESCMVKPGFRPLAVGMLTGTLTITDNNLNLINVQQSVPLSGVATQASLTITASSGSMNYGGTPPLITAGYSGFAINEAASALSVQPACTTSATSASPVSGTYTSSCSGAVDPNYDIHYVNGSVIINPAPLTITASSGSMNYGGTPPLITAGYSAFANHEGASALSPQPTCTTLATSASPVLGTYTSSCSGAADPNYDIHYVNGSVIISPAPLTITASSGAMTYGAAPPLITPNFSVFANHEGASALTTQPVCSTTATSASPVSGTYTSSCSGAADPNYDIHYVNGSVIIAPAPLTITANDASTTYGAGLPGFSGSIFGAENNESFKESFSTLANASSPAGNYSITPSVTGATLANYKVIPKDGVLSILPATLVITADNLTKVLNAPNPALTVSYNGFMLGEDKTNLTGTLSCVTKAVLDSPVGSYPITCSGLNSSNYTITFAPGTLKIIYLMGACPNPRKGDSDDQEQDGNHHPILSHIILDPIDANGSSIFHSGGALPVRFRVCDANGNSIGDPGLITGFVSLNGPPPVSQGDRDDRGWHFDGSRDHDANPDSDHDHPNPHPKWTFQLNLHQLPPATYKYQISLNDGTTIPFSFTVQSRSDHDGHHGNHHSDGHHHGGGHGHR